MRRKRTTRNRRRFRRALNRLGRAVALAAGQVKASRRGDTMRCQSCEALMINGIYCHETGCPDSWRGPDGNGRPRECRWCGSTFVPEDADQEFCDHTCLECYYL